MIDRFVNDVARAVAGLSIAGKQYQTGYLRNYALSIFIGTVALVAYLLIVR
jgi:NADH-quinone oxidoreductase subunit L